ncbi:gamma-glutamylcyclotransferase [Ectothiorhodospiraceae bacterium WFHF3C12]|nr:gamma-glutamylcyclotransferase [Ectothiorhodospiraceae bacterium WFHF3C12]
MQHRPGYYFAYGSNLHPERLGRRTPSQRLLGPAELPAHDLRFHKRSGVDDSAKADAYFTGDPAHRVLGAVYALTPDDFPALDRVESLGAGYDLKVETLTVAGAALEVFLYVAQEAYIDPVSEPFDWYRDLVLHGALYHGFPEPYVRRIRAIAGTADPDADRAARHDEILRAMATA